MDIKFKLSNSPESGGNIKPSHGMAGYLSLPSRKELLGNPAARTVHQVRDGNSPCSLVPARVRQADGSHLLT